MTATKGPVHSKAPASGKLQACSAKRLLGNCFHSRACGVVGSGRRSFLVLQSAVPLSLLRVYRVLVSGHM